MPRASTPLALCLCLTLGGAVHAEDDERLGEWTAPLKARAGRYLGLRQVGADPYHYESLELVLSGDGKVVKLEWARRDQEDERERRTLKVADVQVTAERVALRVVGPRPAEVPERLEGRFATKWPRGKGPVDKGLALGGGWFLARSED